MSDSKNHQISLFGFKCIAKKIKGFASLGVSKNGASTSSGHSTESRHSISGNVTHFFHVIPNNFHKRKSTHWVSQPNKIKKKSMFLRSVKPAAWGFTPHKSRSNKWCAAGCWFTLASCRPFLSTDLAHPLLLPSPPSSITIIALPRGAGM